MIEPSELKRCFEAARPHLRTCGVTGTNGKTTTTSMLAACVSAAGHPSALLTTVGAWVGGERVHGTTAAEEFLATVERAVSLEAPILALETTSKALAAGLATRWPPHVAVFTNLTRDHLDQHGSPEAYLAAKAQLFLALPPDGTAVLYRDDPSSALLDEVLAPDVTRRWFGQGGDLEARRVEVGRTGTTIELAGPRAAAFGTHLHLPIRGHVHALNALAAALAAEALGLPHDAIRRGLESFPGVRGRFELVAQRPFVVVDYAHTPDALDGTLRSAREIAEGRRVFVVFGCGGERDQGKRPMMGALAHALADVVVLTSDNPRREDPAAIARAVREGAVGEGARWLEEPDRRKAIALALTEADANDVVVVAGKGHETTQTIGTETRELDDAAVVRELLA
ncbi:MAG: UDP-N-acetylmuramyl-tripeptide synthetase [Sandaracinus sp.]|nr:UDP-N-acetylmuramyl-tripeptide synthetase [Sandaracinus sp.]